MIKKILALGFASLMFSASANATSRHGYNYRPDIHAFGNGFVWSQPHKKKIKKHRKTRHVIKHKRKKYVYAAKRHLNKKHIHNSSKIKTVILPHPRGCPRVAFCGCGAALEVYGKHVRHLWLARNWFEFPAARPAPGMVAVRRHHVFVIRRYLGNNRVLAYDANSGGRKTRLHVRSLAGYSVRNPRAKKIILSAKI